MAIKASKGLFNALSKAAENMAEKQRIEEERQKKENKGKKGKQNKNEKNGGGSSYNPYSAVDMTSLGGNQKW